MPRWFRSTVRGSAWRTYLGAPILTVLVVWARRALDSSWGHLHNRHLVFLPTVMLCAWFAGFRAGVLSTVISTLALSYYWTGPGHGFGGFRPDVVLFFLISVAICALIGSLHAARARADEARRALEQIMAVVAHDLRNPLSAIGMTATSLRKTCSDEQFLRGLTRIDRGVTRMDHLIGDLLDATRIDHGGLTMRLREENVRSIAQEAVDLYLPLAQEKGVAIELEMAPGDRPVVCDRPRLLQALGNLLGNALKFTPSGGHVLVKACDEGGGIHFEVIDSGPGIKPEHLDHVFERYWNSDGAGTGLGLFIAQSILRAHGGTLGVYSEPGRGASFFFTLPRIDPGRHESVDAS